jgi:hypothetical protein
MLRYLVSWNSLTLGMEAAVSSEVSAKYIPVDTA